jgi:hypothetical protein
MVATSSIVSARIHPAIGIARIGNSPEGYFVGPEVPHPVPPPPGGYKDPEGRLKRQAAQFRIYGYDSEGRVVAELTTAEADISWTVHVANKKAAWYDFVVALDIPEAAGTHAPLRNSWVPTADRHKLIIDPGPRTVSGAGQRSSPFDSGTFFETPVYLGELRTDDAGRLLFLGGRGVSGSPFAGNTMTTFANNSGWYDDISDGPVTATVTVGGREIPVEPAWVVTAPPDYGPQIVTVQTMYDVIYDALAGLSLPKQSKPSFTDDILPLLRQFNDSQWVNKGFFVEFGWGAPNDFLRPDMLARLAAPGDTFQELRRRVFYMFRVPGAKEVQPLLWPPIYGDAFGNFDDSPRAYFAITDTLYGYLSQWVDGNFVADYDPDRRTPASLADVALPLQPATLDRAALHFCMGGPFHPGCEMTWPMRQASMYGAPFRLKHAPPRLDEPAYGPFLTQALVTSDDGPLSQNGPGDISRWMAIPWQEDTASCRSGYPTTVYPDPYTPTFWPSRVPNQVLTEADYATVMNTRLSLEERTAAFNTRANWLRGLHLRAPYVHQITKMVSDFGELGIVEKRDGPGDPAFPEHLYVETQATIVKPPSDAEARLEAVPEEADLPAVSEDFARARFGGRARR